MTLLTLGSGTAAPVVAQNYSNDVFAVTNYTGNGAGLLVSGTVNLLNSGGLLWIKQRDGSVISHKLTDTARGVTKGLSTNSTAAQTTDTNGVVSFRDGSTNAVASLGSDANYDTNARKYTAWTFRKASNFFDVVTYTGNGSTQTINHNLAAVPGCIIVKASSTTSSWFVYHRSVGQGKYMTLETTGAPTSDLTIWNNTAPSSTTFSVGGGANSNGVTYIAYVFSHDSSTTGIVQCGSFTSSGSGDTISLGWEAQWVMYKNTSGTSDWTIVDAQRGFNFQTDATLAANTNAIEVAQDIGNPVNTGFYLNNTATTSTNTYIYIAIRRRNKPATSADTTTTFAAQLVTGGTTPTSISAIGNYAADLIIGAPRLKTYAGTSSYFWDRLRGNYARLTGGSTAAEAATPTDTLNSWDTFTQSLGADSGHYCNSSSENYVYWVFRRAAGAFDQISWTGTGANLTVSHGLGATPELVIAKCRSTTGNWMVYSATAGNTKYLQLNTNIAATTLSTPWNNTSPTATTLTLGTSADVNTLNATYIAYLFATVPGLTKIGTYTGNGTTQTINCGFSAGARWVLIKCTSTTGDWLVWDTTRGIVAANDPYVGLNLTTAEVTSNDSLDPDNSGFVVNQVAASNINVNAATYIFMAFA